MLLTSCAAALKVEQVSPEYRDAKLIYFVENNGKKQRLDQIIASELQKNGINAISGYKSDRPAKFDILVVYEDRWQWDITNYLIHMRIDLRSPSTNALLGTGSSYQTSMARKSENEIIKDIISGMFQK
jgi:hypothetical protein